MAQDTSTLRLSVPSGSKWRVFTRKNNTGDADIFVSSDGTPLPDVVPHFGAECHLPNEASHLRWANDDYWWTMFVPDDGQLVGGRIFDSLNFAKTNPPIQQIPVENPNGPAISVWRIDPLVSMQWTAVEHMLTTLAKFFTSQPYPLRTEHPPSPHTYYLTPSHFAIRNDAVRAVLRSRWAFVVYMSYISGLAAYTDPKIMDPNNRQSIWHRIPDAIRSAFERTWIFFRGPSVRRAGALVDVLAKRQWWERDTLKRVLHNPDVPVWLFFGTHLPEQLVDEQLSEFCPTQTQVDKSLADSWISQTTALNPPA